MATINLNVLEESNKRIARVINVLSEILLREDYLLYEKIIMELQFPKSKEKETEFLQEVYIIMLENLKKINYGPIINN